MSAPAIGVFFRYKEREYVVEGWLKADDRPNSTQQKTGPDHCRLMFCAQAEAEYVSGRGVGGCIARIADIELGGLVEWPQEHYDEVKRLAERLAGTPLR